MGLTVIVVTHDAEAAACARRVVHILDGRIAEDRVASARIGAGHRGGKG